MSQMLKSEVFYVVTCHPQGIPLRELAGVYHQTYSRQLLLAQHGYSSLRDLLEDMEQMVRIDSDGPEPLVRSCPACGGRGGARSRNKRPDLNQGVLGSFSSPGLELHCVSDRITEILVKFPKGLKIRTLEIIYEDFYDRNLNKTAQHLGHQDTFELLKMVPRLVLPTIERTKENCVVKANTGLSFSEMTSLIADILGEFPMGLKVFKLEGLFQERHREDLKEVSWGLGFEDIFQFLRKLPRVFLQSPERQENCVVRTTLGSGFSDISNQIKDLLEEFPSGLRVKKLENAYEEEHDENLQEEVQRLGYDDVLEFLEKVPGIVLQNPTKMENCVVQNISDPGFSEVSASITDILMGFPKGLKLHKLEGFYQDRHEEELSNAAQRLGYGDVLELLEKISGIFFQTRERQENCLVRSIMGVEFSELLAEIMDILCEFPAGLPVRNLESLHKEEQGEDLNERAQSLGCADAFEFLQKMPGVIFQTLERQNYVVRIEMGVF
nr:PREDICTED: uncharacterized protein LOC102367523 isoform X1 [Latimeria chalumnae]XP_014349764.1 PREDICTED: uncharacterized protein LOC102367523 isoform X1 [Latimeria chalumnae]|eukprot:XP_014349763.1 PREDICTED: uncharacterized protein LOC102367523 isoform X1 [Latimeria chalumnae]